jgi:hypothetical protein
VQSQKSPLRQIEDLKITRVSAASQLLTSFLDDRIHSFAGFNNLSGQFKPSYRRVGYFPHGAGKLYPYLYSHFQNAF